MRSLRNCIAITILLFGTSFAGANGSPYYFDKVLERAEDGWLGYRVLVVEVTSFSVALPEIGRKDVYELTHDWDDILEGNFQAATFISLLNSGVFSFRDMGSFERIKPDEVGLSDATKERYVWFKQDELNRGEALVFVPLTREAVPIGKPSIMGIDMSLRHLDFLQGARPDENNRFQLGETVTRFRFAVDREPDGIPDLVVFDAEEGYTRTYLLGRTAESWVILWVGFPM